ncbi:MAG: hypothetical protein ACQETP_08325 [Bacteroidota bacterium]
MSRGRYPVGEQRRARGLLKADEGPEGPARTDAQIADAFARSEG